MMQSKRKKSLCRNCGLLMSSGPMYLSHMKLCISMNDYNGLLLNSPFSLRPMPSPPKRKKSRSHDGRCKRSHIEKETRKRSSKVSWHASPNRRNEVRDWYSKCGDPCCTFTQFSTPKKSGRRTVTMRSPVVRITPLPSPERNAVGNLSTNLKVEKGNEEDDVASDSNSSSLESGSGRRGRKEVSYFCKPCNVTLASWHSIRKHLLSSQHLLTVSPERRLQIASTSRRRRILFTSSQLSSPQTSDPPVKEVMPREKITSQPSPTHVTPPLKVRFDYKGSIPRDFATKKATGSSKSTKDNCRPEEANLLTKEYTEGQEKVNSRLENVSECQTKVSSRVQVFECQTKVDSRLQVSESQVRIDPKSQVVVSECQEKVSGSMKSPSVSLGNPCDSLEFLKKQCRSEVVCSNENETLLSRKSLFELFLYRERVIEEKRRLGSKEAMKQDADGRSRVSTMIRYDYKKRSSSPQYCTASNLLSDGRELNLTPLGQRRVSPGTCKSRRCLFQDNTQVPEEGTSNITRLSTPQVSNVTTQSSCCCSCHSMLERHAIMMLLKDQK